MTMIMIMLVVKEVWGQDFVHDVKGEVDSLHEIKSFSIEQEGVLNNLSS